MVNKNVKWLDKLNNKLETKIVKLKKKNSQQVIMTVSVDYDMFKYILESEFFHLTKDVIINQSRKIFSKNKGVELDLMLNKNLMKASEADEKILLEYLTENINEAIINPDNWYVLNVKQEEDLPPELAALGKVKTGFSTKWNEKL